MEMINVKKLLFFIACIVCLTFNVKASDDYTVFDSDIKNGFQCTYKLTAPYKINTARDTEISEAERNGKVMINQIEQLQIGIYELDKAYQSQAPGRSPKTLIEEGQGAVIISVKKYNDDYFTAHPVFAFKKKKEDFKKEVYKSVEKVDTVDYYQYNEGDGNYIQLHFGDADNYGIGLHGYLQDFVHSGYSCPPIISVERVSSGTFRLHASSQSQATNRNDATYELIDSRKNVESPIVLELPKDGAACQFKNPYIKSCKTLTLNYEDYYTKDTLQLRVEIGKLRHTTGHFSKTDLYYLYINSPDYGVAYRIYVPGQEDDLITTLNNVGYVIKKGDIDTLFADDFDMNRIAIASTPRGYTYGDNEMRASIIAYITYEDSTTFAENNDPEGVSYLVDAIMVGDTTEVREQLEYLIADYKKYKNDYDKCQEVLARRDELVKKYNNFKENMITPVDLDTIASYINRVSKYTCNNGSNSSSDPTKLTGILTCDALFGGEIQTLLSNVLKFIRYGGPLLMLLLTIVDLIKTATSGEEKDFKSVFTRFIKRFIAAALLFFITDIVKLLFLIVGLDYNCEIKVKK